MDRQRLCVLNGPPGVGKTTTCDLLFPVLPRGWRGLRGDDSIGATQVCSPVPGWGNQRRFEPFFEGWSAGWYIRNKSVLFEGHLLDAEERRRFERTTRSMGVTFDFEVISLDHDRDFIAKRRADDPDWEPTISGPGRLDHIKKWLDEVWPEPGSYDRLLDARGLTPLELARKVAGEFRIPIRPEALDKVAEAVTLR